LLCGYVLAQFYFCLSFFGLCKTQFETIIWYNFMCMAVLMKENYGKWCILFGSQDPWEIVNNGYADPMAEEEDRYALEKKNAPNDQ